MRRIRIPTWLVVGTLVLACGGSSGEEAGTDTELRVPLPLVGLPCEGCEEIFVGLPDAPPSTARLAPEDEPGEPMRIECRVSYPDGTPAPGTVVYAYQTNVEGVYPTDFAPGDPFTRHGRLRGWATVDEEGWVRFDTIRPGGYPGADTPEHVHLHVIEPGCCHYYIDDVMFEDDPRLTPRLRESLTSGRGGPGIVTPTRDADGVWQVRRDIVLGEAVPGHPGHDEP